MIELQHLPTAEKGKKLQCPTVTMIIKFLTEIQIHVAYSNKKYDLVLHIFVFNFLIIFFYFTRILVYDKWEIKRKLGFLHRSPEKY